MEKFFPSLIAFLSISVCFSSGEVSDVIGRNESVQLQFRDFVVKYGKSYSVGSEEYFRRMHIFMHNLELSAKLNSLRTHPDSAWYGMTKFSDMTDDEFQQIYLSNLKLDSAVLSRTIKASIPPHYPSVTKDLPKKFDWRTLNIITEPRDQMACGGCWAFASVEVVESMYAKKTKQLISLSVQQMVDCSYNFSSLRGCNGGYTCDAFNWALSTKTVFVPESAYPYVGHDQPCRRNHDAAVASGPSVTNYTCNNFDGSEPSMLGEIVSVGPLAVAVDASNWKNYMGGVIQFHCGEVPNNHAVQIVGYDLTGHIPYYIVKNSWGKEFGNGGYLYVKYGSNVCSIASVVSTAQVST